VEALKALTGVGSEIFYYATLKWSILVGDISAGFNGRKLSKKLKTHNLSCKAG